MLKYGKKSKAKNFCNRCKKTATSETLYCNGFCQSWIHLKCLNIKYIDVKNIDKKELQSWKCQKCSTISSESDSQYLLKGLEDDRPSLDEQVAEKQTENETPRDLSLESHVIHLP